MNNAVWFKQEPAPGTHLILFKGDTVKFTLTLSYPIKGSAWLRTNIGHAQIARDEIIKQVECDEPLLNRDWYDIPMVFADELHFHITLGLNEVGHFKAKCLFIKEDDINPLWPEGENTVVNVEPADTCCANIIYNTFVRQFGHNKRGLSNLSSSEENWIQSMDQKGYAVIPPSGTFRNLIKELDFIIGELGCRILQLLPVHPTPTTYGRMGRFGSPYAALSYTAVDPALAVFDPKATPLEQFIELVDAIHERNAKILMDIAINHTGWAADLHESHPEWLRRDPTGHIEVPGAWGVKWEDLTSLDYRHKDLWQYISKVFLTWCKRGIDGFRCDAGYMIPVPAWKYIVASVREQYPNTIFFLEGLGGLVQTTRDILNQGNFNWAYSELFQNYDRSQIENYIPSAIDISKSDGIMVHYAETHDNLRLASRSLIYSKMRTALCALFSHNGAFAFTNGVEWFATEKIDVHSSPSLNWGATVNQVNHIKRLNHLLKMHPVFHEQTELKLIQKCAGNNVVLLRRHIPSEKIILVVVNLDDKNQTVASWDYKVTDIIEASMLDLITGRTIRINRTESFYTCQLEPGEVLCLTPDFKDLDMLKNECNIPVSLPERVKFQYQRAKALDVFQYYNGTKDLGEFDLDSAAKKLVKDPLEYCRSLNPFNSEPRVVIWKLPRDTKREVMIPPNHFLLVFADVPFRGRIVDNNKNIYHEESFECLNDKSDYKSDNRNHCRYFTLFSPLPVPKTFGSLSLKLSLYFPGNTKHIESPLLYLPKENDLKVKQLFRRTELLNTSFLFLGTNQKGGMLRAYIPWGEIHSKYDALLAANLNPDFPEDRRIMFTRCRAWVVYQGYSQEISINSLDSFTSCNNSQGFWRFYVPSGQGEHVKLSIGIEMITGENALRIVFLRNKNENLPEILDDQKQVRIILRPDIEDRSFHENTKAYLGPEHNWPGKIDCKSDGFVFEPGKDRPLRLKISKGNFVWEPEWYYMVYRSVEAERGLDPNSDLFSPGYFSAFLKGGESVELTAKITRDDNELPDQGIMGNLADISLFENEKEYPLKESLLIAMDHFIVKRGNFRTVIAGYPWFLDWGRDSLIFTRGLIACGKLTEVKEILKQFAEFEKDGTIPNMIRGKDSGNRDTSDAPLWFFVACSELIDAQGNDDFLAALCNGRSIRQILISMANSMILGTPNGIKMDKNSGLLFSPSHFTWMDTNYPACTPREGYPIEIESLWYFALSFLARIDSRRKNSYWRKLSDLVKKSILELFWLENEGYLSDCIYSSSGVSPNPKDADDALRPNQLFAITLGAVTDEVICQKILASCEELLIPGAIRSLADKKVKRPLPVYLNQRLLNDPNHPYKGKYRGDEDTERKPAYHNGTAWTWPFPSFCEAWVKVYGEIAKETSLSLLTSAARSINSQGCIGQLPEIMDGDFPHIPRGCDAQAWGVSEFFRVLKILSITKP